MTLKGRAQSQVSSPSRGRGRVVGCSAYPLRLRSIFANGEPRAELSDFNPRAVPKGGSFSLSPSTFS
jgi:hypothetical protein